MNMATEENTPFLIFAIDEKKLALKLDLVEQVYSAVEVTPLPEAPETILGLINVHGAIIVVLNVRKKLGLRERAIELSDQIVIANFEDRQLALLVDEVVGVIQANPEQIAVMTQRKSGTVNLQADDGHIELYDLNEFLSDEEEEKLTMALQVAYSH
jgi:purine-binding chemotaxis protein CheW